MSYRFASLSSGLLARKGAAHPAMASHRGGNPLPPREEIKFVIAQEPVFPPIATLVRAGYEPAPAPPPPDQPAPPPFPLRPVASSESCGFGGACTTPDPSVADPARRFHVSVRLRQSHFVRLKIASARLRKPGQDIVGEALSMYFRSLDPDLFGSCACAAEG